MRGKLYFDVFQHRIITPRRVCIVGERIIFSSEHKCTMSVYQSCQRLVKISNIS